MTSYKTVPESVHAITGSKKLRFELGKFQSGQGQVGHQSPGHVHQAPEHYLLRRELDAMVNNMIGSQGARSRTRGWITPDSRLFLFSAHGFEAARICDEAFGVGTADPRIAKLIQSDQNAQMAYHIQSPWLCS